ncbi:hypothetical protein ACCO45_013744 [Purpureocillium lilacinum]|uniref:Uncharacterized protein n=1 Tax=Purpureocillium lilacinum TaxID=33203 RepID=A0ACC4D6U3_PURLI
MKMPLHPTRSAREAFAPPDPRFRFPARLLKLLNRFLLAVTCRGPSNRRLTARQSYAAEAPRRSRTPSARSGRQTGHRILRRSGGVAIVFRARQ